MLKELLDPQRHGTAFIFGVIVIGGIATILCLYVAATIVGIFITEASG